MTGHLCDSLTKLGGKVPLNNRRICVTVHTWRKNVLFTLKKEKKCFRQSATIAIFTVNTSGTVPQPDKMLKTGKTQMVKEFIENYRG